MTLSITQRLTLIYAVLSALVLIPAGFALYATVSSRLAAQGSRSVDAAGRNLVFRILHQWDEDLLMEYRGNVDPLKQIDLDVTDWALVRGNGNPVYVQGVLDMNQSVTLPCASGLVTAGDGRTFRVTSVPLVDTGRVGFEELPEADQESAIAT